MVSDDGENFVNADKELRDLVNQLDEDRVNKQSPSSKVVQWFFNPPTALHFGDIHSIMVKSAKWAVK